MEIDLYKLFGVVEGEEFKIEYNDGIKDALTFKIIQNNLYSRLSKDDIYRLSSLEINIIKRIKNIIKLPKKKEFSQDELCVLKNIDKKYKWIARDKSGSLCIFDEKPNKSGEMWNNVIHSSFIELGCFNNLFNSINWEDEEPIRIDDYVERKESV